MQFDSSISSENAQLIKKTMDLYHKGFIEKNIDEIVTRFSYPTFLIFGNTHKSLDNEGTLRNFYSSLIDTLPQDYSYSKVVKSSVKLLDEQNSIVSNIFARYKKDDSEYHRSSALYLLRKDSNEWKIIGLISYELENYIEFT